MITINKRTVKAAVLLISILTALALGGCVKKYSRSDIRSYAQKLTGRSNLTVSENYEEVQEDEEGYLDHLWTVYDEDSGITFHVLDDYYWALEDVHNRLLNDYNSAVFLALLNEGKIPQENSLSLKKTESSGLVNAELTCSFTDLDSLKGCYEDLISVRNALDRAGYEDVSIPYTVKYSNPLRRAIDYEVDEGDTSGELGRLDEHVFETMRTNYLRCALDYRFEEALNEFSSEEIHDLVHSRSSVRIYRTAGQASGGGGTQESDWKPSEDDYYEGVIGSPKFVGISFGTLYALLKTEGYLPQGNAWHFSVVAADGTLLEFSYDFNDLSGFNDAQGKLQKGYYYISDGKKVRMSTYYDNHFEASEIEKLTGLHVAEDRPRLSQQTE
ncbi:MAG: hypothetical protein IKF59_06295 [Lachnospiraceae bacterium]|jgi:hypothetical protein|nr:hypothetical protein [Lachnospiraceae bacterium]